MPRFPRNFIKTEHFHIITQGIDKSYIFDNAEDIKYYIKIMYESAENNNIKIVAYCIMNNHAHILLNAKHVENLSKYMHNINTKYGKYYNKKYDRVGYVFRNRYKAEGIYSIEHLHNCINYIFNNPVKAGICDKPKDYPYSNYKPIIDVVNENYKFIDIDDDKNEEEIIKEYLKENNLKKDELLNNDYELRQAIITLKRDKGISLRCISKILNLNREIVRKIYNK